MKKIFLKDIAKDLNLSKTTVSLVLNNKGDQSKISKDTQQKIKDYVKKHNYVPNHLARGLSRGKSETIGLIIPNISDVFYAKIADCVERKAQEFGYTVIYSSSNEAPKKEAELIKSMLNRQVEGLIIASTQQNQVEIEALKKANFPFVLIDRHYPESATNHVVVDNFEGTKILTEHLLQLGRRKIGLVSLEPGLEAIRQRRLGYEAALEDFGISSKPAWVKELNKDDYPAEMKQAIKELWSFPNAVDAIVFTTHYLTALGLRELKNFKIKVPQEVAIVSFDELSAFDLVDPPITSVTQPVVDIGKAALDILMNEITNKNSKNIKQSVLDTQLIIRKSCGTI
ncbi:MAG: LacI family DNA-binding transcriptional regulator [Saprospiraceae bacterium]